MKALDSAASGTFYALSRIRGRRIVHPHGAGFAATLTVAPGDERTVPGGVFATPGTHQAIVRLSRGAGLPGSVPDILGLALRVEDAYGSGRHQDLLLVSSRESRILRFAILPGPRGFFSSFYSSVAPFATPEGSFVIAARCTDGGPSPVTSQGAAEVGTGRSFELRAARMAGAWARLGDLKLGGGLSPAQVEDLRFNPWNTSDELRPSGPFMRLRDPAYRGSQDGRAGARL